MGEQVAWVVAIIAVIIQLGYLLLLIRENRRLQREVKEYQILLGSAVYNIDRYYDRQGLMRNTCCLVSADKEPVKEE